MSSAVRQTRQTRAAAENSARSSSAVEPTDPISANAQLLGEVLDRCQNLIMSGMTFFEPLRSGNQSENAIPGGAGAQPSVAVPDVIGKAKGLLKSVAKMELLMQSVALNRQNPGIQGPLGPSRTPFLGTGRRPISGTYSGLATPPYETVRSRSKKPQPAMSSVHKENQVGESSRSGSTSTTTSQTVKLEAASSNFRYPFRARHTQTQVANKKATQRNKATSAPVILQETVPTAGSARALGTQLDGGGEGPEVAWLSKLNDDEDLKLRVVSTSPDNASPALPNKDGRDMFLNANVSKETKSVDSSPEVIFPVIICGSDQNLNASTRKPGNKSEPPLMPQAPNRASDSYAAAGSSSRSRYPLRTRPTQVAAGPSMEASKGQGSAPRTKPTVGQIASKDQEAGATQDNSKAGNKIAGQKRKRASSETSSIALRPRTRSQTSMRERLGQSIPS
ncbi:hypothetical protein V8F20_001383 [Naviculisporaceae sp. PSN 640]